MFGNIFKTFEYLKILKPKSINNKKESSLLANFMLVNSLKYSQVQIILYFLLALHFCDALTGPLKQHPRSQSPTFVFNAGDFITQ